MGRTQGLARAAESRPSAPLVGERAGSRRHGIALRVPARLVTLAAIWGSSFLFIKVGDEALSPIQVAFSRMFLGCLTLLCILAARRERLPRARRVWGHLAVAALLLNVLPFSLFAYGELHTTSVLAGIWNATTPLFVFPISLMMLREERLSVDRVAGLALGFLGVLLVLGVWHGFGAQALMGNMACLGAAACYGAGFPYARKYLAATGHSPYVLAGGQLVCAALLSALLLPFSGGMATTTPPGRVVVAVLALGMLGTGVGYILNYSLIRDAGATTASTVTYIIPIFATIEGVAVLREPLTWHEPVGAVIVLLGVAVAQGRVRIGRRAEVGA